MKDMPSRGALVASSLGRLLAAALRGVVETLAPSGCAACGEPLDGWCGPACSDCARRLAQELVTRRCAGCSAELPGAAAAQESALQCGGCRSGRRLAILAPRRHDGVARALVHAFKYRRRRDIAAALARATAEAPDVRASLHCVDVLVPVPADPVRRLERGFDSTGLLARELAAMGRGDGLLARGPRVVSALRVRRHAPQAGRGALARRAAPAGRMSPRWPAALLIRGRRVALVDDVVTTGATLAEAERVVRRLGAESVVALACTRAPGEILAGRGRRRGSKA